MSRKRKRKSPERAEYEAHEARFQNVDIIRPGHIRSGMAGDKLDGFLEGLDTAAYIVKIDGMVDCAGTDCGYRRASDRRCEGCPQFNAERTIMRIMECRTGGKGVDYATLDPEIFETAGEYSPR